MGRGAGEVVSGSFHAWRGSQKGPEPLGNHGGQLCVEIFIPAP